MRNLFIILLVCLGLILACNGVQLKPVAPCIVDKPDGTQIEFNELCAEIEAAGEVSYICNLKKEYDLDACYLHRAMEVVSKEGLIIEGYTAEEFEEWGNWVVERIEGGITYGLLKDIVLAQFTKINKMVGAQVLILGDMFLELPQDELIPEKDIVITVSSIKDLVQEVKTLDMWLN